MKIMKKKASTYRVFCDLDKSAKVRKFAEEHLARESVVEVRAHKALLSENVRVTITFKSNEPQTVIYRAFLTEFKDWATEIRNNNIFVHKEKGFF